VQEPDLLIAWSSTDEGGSSGRVTFEPRDEGARINVRFEWEPTGLKESTGAALGLDERQVRADLERFRDLIEDRHTSSEGWRGTIQDGEVVAEDAHLGWPGPEKSV
jgi:uncharacterized membrane protein